MLIIAITHALKIQVIVVKNAFIIQLAGSMNIVICWIEESLLLITPPWQVQC